MFFSHKISLIYKTSNFFEDLSFLNPRSHLKLIKMAIVKKENISLVLIANLNDIYFYRHLLVKVCSKKREQFAWTWKGIRNSLQFQIKVLPSCLLIFGLFFRSPHPLINFSEFVLQIFQILLKQNVLFAKL